ncbi:MAG: nicotinamide-nucleotide amidohydrolase family protein [Acidobacteriota bacterium]|nr:nicotinamide-nucleotide amidohydrolase family protein [Acidobacteriota bacterium]MDH3784233.1 nicotinamide-nucleotide amidohydrolase family protein [Acidobacteriota bacterium]
MSRDGRERGGDAVDDVRSLAQSLGKLLTECGETIATAESCTGGLIGGALTSVPGSSDWFAGGVIAYTNDVKSKLLGVPADLLERHGAVSEAVVSAMARGVRGATGAGVGIAVSGIAGPAGGTDEKPVGTVCGAIAIGDGCHSTTWRFAGDREHVRQRTVAAALDGARRRLLDRSR